MNHSFYRWLKYSCILFSLLIFAFLKFVEYSDTVSHRVVFSENYSFASHVKFFLTWDTLAVLIFSIVVGVMTYYSVILLYKYIYPKFKSSK